MNLVDLRPRLSDPSEEGSQFLVFLCPICRKHEIGVDIWAGKAGVVDLGARPDGTRNIKKLWHAEQGPHRDWETLSITPSIDRSPCGDPCGGWHGFITNGQVT